MTAAPPQNPDPSGCLVPFVAYGQIQERMQGVLDRARRLTGHFRPLTRAAVSSRTVWQAATRAKQFFTTTRILGFFTKTLACLYTSLLNGCMYCIGAVIREGLLVSEMLAIRDLSMPDLGEGTVARLLFRRRAVRAPDNIPVRVGDELRAHTDDEQILELTTIVAMKCFWNHFVSALHIPPEGRRPDEILIGELSEISCSLRAGA